MEVSIVETHDRWTAYARFKRKGDDPKEMIYWLEERRIPYWQRRYWWGVTIIVRLEDAGDAVEFKLRWL